MMLAETTTALSELERLYQSPQVRVVAPARLGRVRLVKDDLMDSEMKVLLPKAFNLGIKVEDSRIVFYEKENRAEKDQLEREIRTLLDKEAKPLARIVRDKAALPTSFARPSRGVFRPDKSAAWNEVLTRFADRELVDLRVAWQITASFDGPVFQAVLMNGDEALLEESSFPEFEPLTHRLDFSETEPKAWNAWSTIHGRFMNLGVPESRLAEMKERLGSSYLADVLQAPPEQALLQRRVRPNTPTLWILSDYMWEKVARLGPQAQSTQVKVEQVGGITIVRPRWTDMETTLLPAQDDRLKIEPGRTYFSPSSVAKWLDANDRIGFDGPEVTWLSRLALTNETGILNHQDIEALRFLGHRSKPFDAQGWTSAANLSPNQRERLARALQSVEQNWPNVFARVCAGDLSRASYRILPSQLTHYYFQDGMRFTGFPGSIRLPQRLDKAAAYVGDFLAKQNRMPSRDAIEAKINVSVHEAEALAIEVMWPDGRTTSISTQIEGRLAPLDYKPFSSLPDNLRDTFWQRAMNSMRSALKRQGSGT